MPSALEEELRTALEEELRTALEEELSMQSAVTASRQHASHATAACIGSRSTAHSMRSSRDRSAGFIDAVWSAKRAPVSVLSMSFISSGSEQTESRKGSTSTLEASAKPKDATSTCGERRVQRASTSSWCARSASMGSAAADGRCAKIASRRVTKPEATARGSPGEMQATLRRQAIIRRITLRTSSATASLAAGLASSVSSRCSSW